MSEQAVKPDRTEALLRLLAASSNLTLDELSRAFGVSRRTVRRCLRDAAAGLSEGDSDSYELALQAGGESAGARQRSRVTLKSAIERLLEHPAIRNDSELIASLKEIESFSSRRVGERPEE